MSERLGNILPVPKAFTLLGVQCILQCDAQSCYQMATQITKRVGQHTATKNICISYVWESLGAGSNTVPVINVAVFLKEYKNNWSSGHSAFLLSSLPLQPCGNTNPVIC